MRRPSSKHETPSDQIRCAREYSVVKTACFARRIRYSFEYCSFCRRRAGSPTYFVTQRAFGESPREPLACRVAGRGHRQRCESGRHLLDVHEVAELLHVPVSWVYGRMRKRSLERLPGYRLGKYWRFRKDEVLAWVDCHCGRSHAT